MRVPASLSILLASTSLITSCSQSPVTPAPGALGASWTLVATCEEFHSLSGTSSTNVYALGGAGTLLHYDGTAWAPSNAPMPFENVWWDKLWCVTPNDMFILGNSRTLVGGTWIRGYHLCRFDRSTVTPIEMFSDGSVYNDPDTPPITDLWGSSADRVFVVGAKGRILHYDGSSWQSMDSGTTEDILAIWGLPTGELFAATQHGVLYYDGAAWKTIFTTENALLADIWATSPHDIFVVGEAGGNGAVVHYDGQSWSLTTLDGLGLGCVFGNTSSDIYAGGEYNPKLIHFDGVSWKPVYLPDSYGFEVTAIWGWRRAPNLGHV